MKTIAEKEKMEDNQQQLAIQREKLLILMREDFKIIKTYLSQLKELGRELKMGKTYANEYFSQ